MLYIVKFAVEILKVHGTGYLLGCPSKLTCLRNLSAGVSQQCDARLSSFPDMGHITGCSHLLARVEVKWMVVVFLSNLRCQALS